MIKTIKWDVLGDSIGYFPVWILLTVIALIIGSIKRDKYILGSISDLWKFW